MDQKHKDIIRYAATAVGAGAGIYLAFYKMKALTVAYVGVACIGLGVGLLSGLAVDTAIETVEAGRKRKA
jgi:hypothetical protein